MLVDIETPLGYLTAEKLLSVIELWAEAYPARDDADDLGTDYLERDHLGKMALANASTASCATKLSTKTGSTHIGHGHACA